MNKKTILYVGFIGIASLISFSALTNSSGPPQGHTGSPKSNGLTCSMSNCHIGGPLPGSQTINITTDIPASGYLPDTDYNITVTANTGGSSHPKIGFQASVEYSTTHLGTLKTGGNNELKVSGRYIGHSSSGINSSGGQKSWTFVWNSGNSIFTGEVYVAVNFANGDGESSGDVIVTQMLGLNKDNNVSIEEPETIIDFSVYPNPAVNRVRLQGLTDKVEAIVITDVLGREVRRIKDFDIENEQSIISLDGLSSGNYLLVLEGVKSVPRHLIIE
ncbi:MAG: choice-of-anchor V domain-containing protein [Owenweeksia sp.]